MPRHFNPLHRYAFASCPDLVDIYLPASVTSVDTAAFKGCVRLEERAAKVELTVEQYVCERSERRISTAATLPLKIESA
jgi:hypothetical protein